MRSNRGLEDVARAVGRTRGQPAAVAELFATIIRDVARTNGAVGRELLIGSLPRSSVPADVLMLTEDVDWSGPVFLHIPSDDKSPYMCMPTAIGGGAIFTGGMVTFGGAALPNKTDVCDQGL